MPCYRVLDMLERQRAAVDAIGDAIADRVTAVQRASGRTPVYRWAMDRGHSSGSAAANGRGSSVHLSSAVNFWIFLHAFSSCSSDVA
jgi:hypothetical protein